MTLAYRVKKEHAIVYFRGLKLRAGETILDPKLKNHPHFEAVEVGEIDPKSLKGIDVVYVEQGIVQEVGSISTGIPSIDQKIQEETDQLVIADLEKLAPQTVFENSPVIGAPLGEAQEDPESQSPESVKPVKIDGRKKHKNK